MVYRNPWRPVDPFHASYIDYHKDGKSAADEIIDDPDTHLLTQREVFQAEGGILTVGLQAGALAALIAGLFGARKELATGFTTGTLKFGHWALLGGTGFLTYWFSYEAGVRLFGNQQQLHAHNLAYTYVKTVNRMKGRRHLPKRGRY